VIADSGIESFSGLSIAIIRQHVSVFKEKKMKNMASAYGEWVIRWRYVILLATLILVALAASGARFLTFKTDYRVFFSEDNPQLLAFEELQNTYTKTDNVLFVLAPKDGNVFTPETLASVAALTTEAWQLPYSLRVDSLTNYQHTRAEGDDLIVDDLVPDPSALTAEQLQDIRAIAVNEPLLVSRLISADGRVTGVNVTIQLPDEGTGKEVPAITDVARKMVDQARADNPNLDIYLTGMVMLNNSFPEVSVRDQKTLIPIMFAIVLITLALLLRSVPSMIGTFMVISFSIVTAMGLAGWLGFYLTPPSASSPPIVLTLAVSLSGCVGLGPGAIQGSRADYNVALRRTDDEQLLLNLVRLRYRDRPLFLEASSLTTQFTFGGTLGEPTVTTLTPKMKTSSAGKSSSWKNPRLRTSLCKVRASLSVSSTGSQWTRWCFCLAPAGARIGSSVPVSSG